VQVAADFADDRDSLKPAVTMSVTRPAVNWPKPCMAKTEPIMAPRHLVVANLMSLSGGATEGELGCNLLGGNDGGKWVITANADTHDNTPEADNTSDGNGAARGGESLSESSEDDDDELKTVHALATDNVGQDTEDNLSNNVSTGLD
jgi:hypothetical protein